MTARAILRTAEVIQTSLPPLVHQQRILFLPSSLPTGVSPYRFEPVYDPGEEPSTISVVLPTDTEDPEVSRVGNTEW